MTENERQHILTITAGVAFIVAASLVVYIPAMCGGYIWDDDVYVEENSLLSSPDGLRNIWTGKNVPSQYVPMVYTTFRFEYLLWGLQPFGYHLTNVLLHAFNALLIWLLLARLKIRGAWLVSAIFALHPVHVESVAWITERKNVLSLFFCLVSAVAYFQYAFGSSEELTKGRSETFYQLSTFLFLCALASKAVVCFFPVLLLIVLWWKHGRIILKDIRDLSRFFVLGLAWGLLVVWWEHKHQGTGTVEFGLTPIKRVLLASHAIWFYLGKLFYPVNLMFSYPKWNIEPTNPLNYTWLFLSLVAAWGIWHWRERLQRGPIAAIAFFIVALLPMLGFFSLYTFVYTYVADHYQYVASIGPITLFVSIGCIAVNRLGKYAKGISITSVVLILLTLGTLTWRQCHIYKDRDTLWQDTIRNNPDSLMAYLNLGIEYYKKDRLDEATSRLKKVLQLSPDYAEVYNDLGWMLMEKGNLDEAARYFLLTLQKKPNDGIAYNNLGLVFMKKGNLDEAARYFLLTLQKKPNDGIAYNNLGLVFMKKGNLDEAISYFQQALQIMPGSAEAHNNLGIAFLSHGDFEQAMHHYSEALRIRPNFADAHYNLGSLLDQRGKLDEAIQEYMKALEINPNFAKAKAALVAARSKRQFGGFETETK
jgi:tetratricopeptide (TPR) repeat protein